MKTTFWLGAAVNPVKTRETKVIDGGVVGGQKKRLFAEYLSLSLSLSISRPSRN
jgi:hypothetical protein